jgi:hypothetical protein
MNPVLIDTIWRHKWKIVIGTIITGLLVTVWAQSALIATAKEKYAKLDAEHQQTLLAIKTQNKAIAVWEAAAAAQQARADKAAATLAGLRRKHQAALASLAAQPVPVDCNEAVRWGNEKIVDIVRSW